MTGLFSAQRVPAACMVLALSALFGCDGTFVAPGIVRPGANRPPVISTTSARLSANGQIELRAYVFDPESDGLSVDFEQTAGPFAEPTTRIVIGGALDALLKPTGTGLHAFRIRASDGFFVVSADVSITLGDPAAERADLSLVGSAARPLPTGTFEVQISGQVLSDAGLTAFALPATIDIARPPPGYLGENGLVVSISTHAQVFQSAAPPGALLLKSSATVGSALDDVLSVRGNGRNTIITFSQASGPSDDVFVVSLSSRDITLTGPIDDRGLVTGSPARFRTDERDSGPFGVGAALVRLQPLGDSITGEIRLSSYRARLDDLLRGADYSANFTGRKIR